MIYFAICGVLLLCIIIIMLAGYRLHLRQQANSLSFMMLEEKRNYNNLKRSFLFHLFHYINSLFRLSLIFYIFSLFFYFFSLSL